MDSKEWKLVRGEEVIEEARNRVSKYYKEDDEKLNYVNRHIDDAIMMRGLDGVVKDLVRDIICVRSIGGCMGVIAFIYASGEFKVLMNA